MNDPARSIGINFAKQILGLLQLNNSDNIRLVELHIETQFKIRNEFSRRFLILNSRSDEICFANNYAVNAVR
jgi:hypothetical protein